MLCMMFGQLNNRDSLSDLLLCLKPQRNKWYHLGIGNSISKSNLAYANEHHVWRIFEDFAAILIAQARIGASTNTELDYLSDKTSPTRKTLAEIRFLRSAKIFSIFEK